ncbi:MAG TPA: hypothetical protein VHV78_10240, partial [Gemmatimonadaceae bacterium]|nr:hypothetical protein [Gemmatimonadaceae bacterium]
YKSDPGELLFGLRQRLGIAKGRNSALEELSGTVLLKYDPRGQTDEIFVRDVGAKQRLVRCVDLARDMLRRITETDFATPSPLLGQLLLRFFSIHSADLDARAIVKQKFTTIFHGISGPTRIAANRSIGKAACGYVTWKKIEEVVSEFPSPYKTRGTPHDNKERFAGSVHLDLSIFLNNTEPWRDEGIAGLIIHEASHKYCFTDDHAYVHEDEKFNQLSKALKLDTADAYGYAAVSLRQGVVIQPPLRSAAA